MYIILGVLSSIFTSSSAALTSLIHAYGYLALFILMTLEGTSLPVASEVVIPLAGLLAQQGTLNFILAFVAVFVGNIAGTLIAYYIGYFLGKDVIYKHLRLFRIKQQSLDSFDAWFEKNGAFAVFMSRLIPEVRGLIGFPAGFAKMPIKKYLAYTSLGTVIWDFALFLFGYYLISSSSITIVSISVAGFAILIVLIYFIAMKRIRNRGDGHKE